jgi:hypothetical protein
MMFKINNLFLLCIHFFETNIFLSERYFHSPHKFFIHPRQTAVYPKLLLIAT